MTQTAINYGVVLYQLDVKRECVKAAADELLQVPQLKMVLTDPTLESGKSTGLLRRFFQRSYISF